MPHVARRSCDDCEKYQYEDDAESFAEAPFVLASGLPMARPRGAKTPCCWCLKVPSELRMAGATRVNAIEPSERSWAALWHYRKCRAVFRFPDDPLVAQNAACIATMELMVENARLESTAGLLGLIGSMVRAGKQ